jgi:hypothetical protein
LNLEIGVNLGSSDPTTVRIPLFQKMETYLISDRRIFQEGKTPLHVAAEAGDADGVLFLQVQGASNDPKDSFAKETVDRKVCRGVLIQQDRCFWSSGSQ